MLIRSQPNNNCAFALMTIKNYGKDLNMDGKDWQS
jgi:hypothetical protein